MAAFIRKSLFRRMLAALLGCCLLFCAVSAFAEEEKEEEEYPFADRFGYEAKVTTDADGNPA